MFSKNLRWFPLNIFSAGTAYHCSVLLLALCLLFFINSCIGMPLAPQQQSTQQSSLWNDRYAPHAYFAASVLMYTQGPSQYQNNTNFCIRSNEYKLLGAPHGAGKNAASLDSIVSLGMAGGYVIVKFEPPIVNHPDNIGGFDFIVFGNAISYGISNTYSEPGVIWVAADANHNGLCDDAWYLIAGSHLSNAAQRIPLIYDITNSAALPGKKSFFPQAPVYADYPGTLTFTDFVLPPSLYGVSGEYVFGYADHTPTLILGDMNANDSIHDADDEPNIAAHRFYTIPSAPNHSNTFTHGSGGGDAIKLEWAVDPIMFTNVFLNEVSFIKIVSGATNDLGNGLNEASPEIDAVARVRRNAEQRQ